MKFVKDDYSIFNLKYFINGDICGSGEMCLNFDCKFPNEHIYFHPAIYEELHPHAKEAIIHSFQEFTKFIETKDENEIVFDFSFSRIMIRYENSYEFKEKQKDLKNTQQEI